MLRLNSNSLAVVRLQMQLRRLGFYDGLITGIFGISTDLSVKEIQSYYKLHVDGIVGPKTQNVLNFICANDWHVLFIHCAATPEGRNDKADNIILGQMLPNKTNGCVFMGKNTTIDKVIGQQIPLTGGGFYTIKGRELSGRGWSRPGYSDVIELDGKIVNIHRYNNDNQIHEWEQTWGVHGSTLLNRNARHVCVIGGMSADLKQVKDTRTDGQKKSLEDYVLSALDDNPLLIIAGHNEVQHKGCPSFDVREWCASLGIPEFNIGQWSNNLRL
jgi:N-acetylmuramoyl-L-alanine amidase